MTAFERAEAEHEAIVRRMVEERRRVEEWMRRQEDEFLNGTGEAGAFSALISRED
jgi:hypothetical protein